jgi:hypothetical protein
MEMNMLRSVSLLGVFLALLIAVPRAADAQNPQTHQGFFIGFGLGAGSFGAEGSSDRETGGAGYLRIGGALSPQLLLAGESAAWTKSEGGGRLTHANLSAIMQFYPSATSGFYLKGGAGLSQLRISISGGGGSVSAEENGLGLTAGLGYDFRLGTNFSLSPYGSFAWGSFDGGTANHGQVGLGVTWH